MKKINGVALGTILIAHGVILGYFLTKKLRAKRNKERKFQGFVLDKILSEKCVLGHYENCFDQKIIATIDYPTFKNMDSEKFLNDVTIVRKFHKNSEYEGYRVNVENFELNLNTIYPAPELQISKRTKQSFFRFFESPQIYEKCTKPYIDSIPEKNNDWIEAIFYKGAEADKVIYMSEKEKAFALIHDERYAKGQTHDDDVHLLAIKSDKSKRCLRCLDQSDLKTLQEMRQKGLDTMKDLFGFEEAAVLSVVHYLPTFFRFHVHFLHLSNQRTLKGCVYLEDVIENLKRDGDFYKTASLTFYLGERRHKSLLEAVVALQSE